MKRKICLVLSACLLCGCSSTPAQANVDVGSSAATVNSAVTSYTQIEDAETTESTGVIVYESVFSNKDESRGIFYEDAYNEIVFNGTAIESVSESVIIDGSTVTITEAGTYKVAGTLEDGSIIVDVGDEKVQILLYGVTMTNTQGACINVLEADKVFITLDSNSTNSLTSTVVEGDSVDAAIFAKSDLTLNGEGTLNIVSNGNGVTSKDDLVLTSGEYNIEAVNHGLDANDSISIKEITLNVVSGKDGLHCENSDDIEKGYIYIESGTFNIVAEGDGLDSSSIVTIDAGDFDILTGGGHEFATYTVSESMEFGMQGGRGDMPQVSRPSGEFLIEELPEELLGELPEGVTEEMLFEMMQQGMLPEGTEQGMQQGREQGRELGMEQDSSISEEDTVSVKGIKGGMGVVINGGTFYIDSASDTIHSDQSLEINGGVFELYSGDDAIHSEYVTTINDGFIYIYRCYEGIEGETVDIYGGFIDIISDDDGVNSSKSADATGEIAINIYGGYLNIDAYYEGDGVDSNSLISMSGGEVYISGTTDTRNTTLDYSGSSVITGGVFVAVGSLSQTTQNFGESSTQGSIYIELDTIYTGTITIEDSSGSIFAVFEPTKEYQTILISTPEIVEGGTYTIRYGTGEQETVYMETLLYGEGNEHSMMSGMQGGRP